MEIIGNWEFSKIGNFNFPKFPITNIGNYQLGILSINHRNSPQIGIFPPKFPIFGNFRPKFPIFGNFRPKFPIFGILGIPKLLGIPIFPLKFPITNFGNSPLGIFIGNWEFGNYWELGIFKNWEFWFSQIPNYQFWEFPIGNFYW